MGLFRSRKKNTGPARPHTRSFAGWEAPTELVEVAESLQLEETFEQLFAGMNVEDFNGAEFEDWAFLVRDQGNVDDYCAVCVWVRGYFVGWLNPGTARDYVVEMNGLDSQNLNLAVPARLWAQRTRTRLANRVTLTMPPVGGVGPMNKFPKKAFTILPPGPEVPVVGFEDHIEVFRKYISTGRQVPVSVVLKSSGKEVTAFLDGKNIGQLSPVQAAEIEPLVTKAQARKLIPVARGILFGSDVATDMWLLTGGVSEVGTSWIPTQDGGK